MMKKSRSQSQGNPWRKLALVAEKFSMFPGTGYTLAQMAFMLFKGSIELAH